MLLAIRDRLDEVRAAGIALSPYVRNETYSTTEPRKRQLWIEFAEPVKDPQDALFARVLAVAPDQLLSRNHLDLLAAPEESVLPIDPEHIRVVTDGATNDLAGLPAMQVMEKSTSSDRHYLLPLPPGLVSRLDSPVVAGASENVVGAGGQGSLAQSATRAMAMQAVDVRTPSPVSDELGHHRLLRTSPLVKVPPVC